MLFLFMLLLIDKMKFADRQADRANNFFPFFTNLCQIHAYKYSGQQNDHKWVNKAKQSKSMNIKLFWMFEPQQHTVNTVLLNKHICYLNRTSRLLPFPLMTISRLLCVYVCDVRPYFKYCLFCQRRHTLI